MRALGVLVICAVLAVGATALAQSADALIDEGVALREHGKDQEALERFTRAWATVPSARARAQMALAEQALGRWPLAEAHLEEALRSQDPWIGKNRSALDGALATVRTHLGDLLVDGAQEGAEVSVDGTKVGSLPLSSALRLEVGSHVLVVRKDGYFPFERSARVSNEAPSREHVELVAQSHEAPPPPRDPEVKSPSPPHDEQPLIQPLPSDTGNLQRTIGWVFFAASAPFLITGVVGVLGRASAISTYNDNRGCPGIDQPNPSPQCQSLIDSADGWRTVSIVGFTGAGVMIAGSLVVILTAPRAPAPRVACAPSFGGVACSGVF